MNVEDILVKKISDSNEYKSLNIEKVKNITGLKGGGEALFFAALFEDKKESLLIVKETEEDAALLSQSLNFYKVQNYHFPDYDTVPFAKISPVSDVAHDRINILYKLLKHEKCIVVCSMKSILRKLPKKIDLINMSLNITLGDKIDLGNLRIKLSDLGYVIEREALEKGISAIRGSIIDIFSVTYDNPIRIELFDEEVESIRYFRTEDGRSFKNVDSVEIHPAREVVYDDDNLKNILEKEDIGNELKENLLKSKYFAGSENLLPIFYDDLETIFDYFKDKKIFLDDALKLKNVLNKYIEAISYSFEENDNIFRIIENYNALYIDREYFDNIIKKSINISPFLINDEIFKFNFKEGLSFKSRLTEFIDYLKEYKEKDYFIVLSTSHGEQANRFFKLTEELNPKIVLNKKGENNVKDNIENKETDEIDSSKDNFIITVSSSSSGFILDDIKTIFIADWEVFGRKRKKLRKIPKVNKSIIETFVDLNVGDYAVHINYGIGKYLGLTRKSSNGKEKDYITLEYDKGDKLYIPVEQMNFVQKYISAHGDNPKLTCLGGSAWDKIKSKAKSDALAMARDLIRLYAIRSNIQGTVYGADTQWQDDFEASFKYEETIDQLRAIEDIKKDMESNKMMDRLICGDVGFGKTEVAFRALFKAIMAGKQAAILCPTTILSKQHYNNAQERFKDFPIKIELLNRFATNKDAQKVKENLKNGSCDLAIGTHMLLSNDVVFKNLGLIVIDEEQRFGVKHKESLKQLRLETDVLTLSATPIPRTLNMALTGIRDISIIETPPLNRIPVKTFVTEFSENAMVNAIERELAREGQVFFLYNRIDTIDSFAIMVKSLCKKARIAIAHGRLSGNQLENIMSDFVEHKYDILISTTIIENGIDIPNANTILIDHANKLGLSELYQLRGRVGRSDREAYAYMFYPNDMALTEVAYKRLEAISEHTDLGAGFKIAMRDLEIRGAGNILGKEQSGMIYQVGYELYTQMLEEATNEYKGEIKEVTFDTVIDFKHNLFIPDEYIKDPKEKISAYKLIMRAQDNEDIEYAKIYIEDKYGKMPKEIIEIFDIASLKIVLKRVRVLSVIEGNYNIYIRLDEYSHIDGQNVLDLIKEEPSGVYLDKNNFNQLIIPVGKDSLSWKINKVQDTILRIESQKEDIENQNDNIDTTATNDSKIMTMSEANLEAMKRKKRNNINRNKPPYIIKVKKN